ncbi:hypothetical protein [Erythrobacter ani]|uniref:Uncharacterized protein n=1 Tax=Erythrobacter ani TaxID=2827235 RepID=A0ABS6SN18_9SPHN|nr:hypothetical protein [Erythrobacter ani]MBV7266425.1 hypothetical protein [Erythrobacter ani]
MIPDNFLPRCHPHMLGEGGGVDISQCEALAKDMAELRGMGVILTLVGSYQVGAYRYTNLGDALAHARHQRVLPEKEPPSTGDGG